MSLKIKLVLYNVILMSIMVIIVICFMFSISGSVIYMNAESQLKEVVEDNIQEIEYKNGNMDYEDVDFYEDQVSTLIYSEQGVLLAGNTKTQILENLIDGQVLTVEYEGIEYIIYDVYVESNQADNIYVRGVISTATVSNVLNEVFLIAIIMLPIFIILSAIGSYFMSKKSLKPLDTMIETAEKICNEDDLSLRINAKKGKDEVSRMATTFDHMMEKLELMVIHEKQFTSDVSHELRTPVSVILTECEIAENGNEEELNEAIQSVKAQAKKMKVLISQLLNLIRLENGLVKPEFEDVDVSELIEMVCYEQKLLLPNNLCLVEDIQQDIQLQLDYAMISRVITNLINNSVKYIGEGSIISVTLKQTDNTIILSVSDDGLGISLQDQPHIFTRFYQVDKSRTQESMGLGLSMVKQLVELNHGVIKVSSQEGQGSTFEIKFEKQ